VDLALRIADLKWKVDYRERLALPIRNPKSAIRNWRPVHGNIRHHRRLAGAPMLA
jgi:hypothetical protein